MPSAASKSPPPAPTGAIKLAGEIPPADWATYTDGRYDPPKLEVEDEAADIVWIASEEWAATNGIEGSSQIDSYEIEGLTASGTATFISRRAVERGGSTGRRRVRSA